MSQPRKNQPGAQTGAVGNIQQGLAGLSLNPNQPPPTQGQPPQPPPVPPRVTASSATPSPSPQKLPGSSQRPLPPLPPAFSTLGGAIPKRTQQIGQPPQTGQPQPPPQPTATATTGRAVSGRTQQQTVHPPTSQPPSYPPPPPPFFGAPTTPTHLLPTHGLGTPPGFAKAAGPPAATTTTRSIHPVPFYFNPPPGFGPTHVPATATQPTPGPVVGQPLVTGTGKLPAPVFGQPPVTGTGQPPGAAGGAPLTPALQAAIGQLPSGQLPKDIDMNDVKYLASHTPNCFYINDFIAEGGFGKVYKVIAGDNQLNIKKGQLLAGKVMKVWRHHKEYNSKMQAMCRELSINQLLCNKRLQQPHSNILVCESLFKVFDVDTEEERAYMIMEFSNFGPPNAVIKSLLPPGKGFSDQETSWLTLGLARGVEYLKNFVGMAHLDIKLGNVLLNNNPDPLIDPVGPQRFIPKLCDFSLSAVRNPQTDIPGECRLGIFRGTPGWIAPEIMRLIPNSNYNAFQADVYSLGLVVHVLRTRGRIITVDPRLPKQDKLRNIKQQQPNQVIQARLMHRFKGNVHQGLGHLLMNMLLESPDHRPTIEEVLQHPWLQQFQPPQP